MIKRQAVTIGIPMHNEEATILNLVTSLLDQNSKSFELEKILVISDGTTDKSLELLSKMDCSLLEVVNDGLHLGKPKRVNEIFNRSKSDVVVILDADCILASKDVISQLVEPFLSNNKLGLTSGVSEPVKPKNTIQKISQTRLDIWDRCKSDENVSDMYFCDGSIRAFSRKLYTKLSFPDRSADEAFSYFACIQFGFDFKFIKEAKNIYTSPSTLKDLLSQTQRYILSPSIQIMEFDKKLVDDNFNIGINKKIRHAFAVFIKSPFMTIAYILITILARFLNLFRADTSGKWDVLTSTKVNPHESKIKLIMSNYDDIQNPFYAGGGAQAIHEVAKGISRDFEVTVVTGKYPGAKNEIVDGVKYERIGLSYFGPKIGQLAYLIALYPYFIKQTFDLWVESFTPPISTSFLPLLTKRPVIGIVHMLSGEDMRRKYILPFNLIEKFGLKTYKYILVTSQTFKEIIREKSRNSEIGIIQNGYTPYENTGSQDSNEKYALFMGRIEINQKGLDLLIKAIGFTSKDVKLIIAGSGTHKEVDKLQSLIKSSNEAERIKYVGKVEGKEKYTLINNATLSVISSRFETFSIFALESLAAGLPIVAFDLQALEWIPNETIYKTTCFDARELGENIQKVIDNPQRRMEIAKIGAKYAKDRTWIKVSAQYKQFFEAVLDKERRQQ